MKLPKMQTINGCLLNLDQLPIEPLIVIGDLINNHKGPLLSVLSKSLFPNKDNDENYYFYYWCDVDDNCNRWLIIRVTKLQIKKYLQAQESLLNIILNPIDNYYFIVDRNIFAYDENIWLVMPYNLPKSYLPTTDSYYDKKLSGVNEEDWVYLQHRFLID
jgi:hypothetical protein